MHRVNFYLTDEQVNFLRGLKDIKVSEHIRRAIDQYIERLKNLESGKSPSNQGGDTNA